MKPFLTLLFIIAGVLILGSSCTKKSDSPTSILGKWNIKIDSSSTGVGSGYHPVAYVGQPGDYFNFKSDGHVYISENSVLDTRMYTLSSDSIVIQNFSFAEGKCRVPSPSTHNLVITSGHFITPGGDFGRTVYLAR